MYVILCPFFLAAAWQAPNVTYRSPAKTIPALLKDLSEQTKLTLKASGEACKEVVIVSVKDVPLPTLMEKIAAATSCKWKQTDDGYTLVPDEALRSKEVKEALAERTETVRKAIAEALKDAADAKKEAVEAMARAKAKAVVIAKKPVTTDDGAKKQTQAGGDDQEEDDDGDGAPGMGREGDQDVSEFLKLLEPEVLANLLPGDRVVWASNNPTGLQRSLNGDASGLVQQWLTDHNNETSEMPPEQLQMIQKMIKEHPELAASMKDMAPQKVTGSVYKLIISAELGGPFDDGSVAVSACAFDKAGKILLDGQTTFSMDSERQRQMLEAIKADGPGKAKPAKPDPGKPIVYSPNSKLLLQLAQGPDKGSPFSMHVSKELIAVLSHPETIDPLSLVASDGLMQYADDKGRQLVADVPDSAEGGGMMDPGEEDWKGLNDIQRGLDRKERMSATDDGAFLVIRPAQPAVDRLDRVDRNDLRKLFEAVEARRVVDLDSLCQFALSNPGPSDNGIEALDAFVALPGLMQGFMGGTGTWQLLRLYGTLDATQRASLMSGTPIPFARLSEAQRGYLERIVFGANSSLQDRSSQPQQEDDGGMFGMIMGQFGQGPHDDYRHEPTELMPQGLPASGSLQCHSDDAPVFFASTGESSLLGFPFGPQEIAIFGLVQQNGASGGGVELPQSGFVGLRRTLKFTLNLSPAIIQNGALMDLAVPAGSTQTSITSLPSEFQAKVDKAKAAFSKSFGPQGGAPGGVSATPR